MSKKRVAPFFILLILFLVAYKIEADEPLPEIRIAIGEQPPLFSEKGGIVDMVIFEALLRGGYTAVFEWLPIGRMLKLLENDTLECYASPTNTAGQHNPHVVFLAAKGVFFYLARNTPSQPVVRLEDLAGKKVGTVTNSPLRPLFEGAGILVDEGPFETMFFKLASGRVDYVSTADVGGILSIMKDFPGRENEFAFTTFSYTTIGAGLYVKPGPEREVILEAARRGFAAMKADGSLNQMLRAFFGPEHHSRVFIY